MGCLYRKLKQYKPAMIFLEKALLIEYKYLINLRSNENFESFLQTENPADTHLNLCAVLSAIGKHDIARLHALKAVTFLQDEILMRNDGIVIDSFKPLEERYGVLCIAYYNLGTELEYMSQKEEALEAYKKANKYAKKHLSPSSSLAKNMKHYYYMIII